MPSSSSGGLPAPCPSQDPTAAIPAPGPELAGLGEGVYRTALEDGRHVVVKRHTDAPADFFVAEVAGLEALRFTGALRVPGVHAVDRHCIVLEDLGRSTPSRGFWAAAGAGLAAQHASHADRFGFARDGYCGHTRQYNTPTVDGHVFFANCRLRPQLSMARDAGLLDGDDARRGERLLGKLGSLLPHAAPVLVHGDLWLGNLHCCGDGAPALIDAGAVHHGWAESDLAMLILFGDPDARFFAAYSERTVLAQDWRERAAVLNLYHLLNHLNLFGSSYRQTVRAVLRRFA